MDRIDDLVVTMGQEATLFIKAIFLGLAATMVLAVLYTVSSGMMFEDNPTPKPQIWLPFLALLADPSPPGLFERPAHR